MYPVQFIWASALAKNLKKKNFFFEKILTPDLGFWAPKNAKKTQKSGVLTICGYTKHTSVYKPTPIQWLYKAIFDQKKIFFFAQNRAWYVIKWPEESNENLRLGKS